MKSNIVYNGESIPFEVKHVDRKTMEIAVHPDGRVLVKAPVGTTLEAIRVRVTRRARWVKKKLEYFRQFEPRTPLRQYVGGETHLYLGRQYRLKFVKSADSEVKLKGGYFIIKISDRRGVPMLKKMLDKWYFDHAISIFQKRLQISFGLVKKLNVSLPKIRIRKLTKRWGSCWNSGCILLNTELVKTPIGCIDYVITHELCHLKVPVHSKKYYRLLKGFMPDWEKRKDRLEKISIGNT